MVATRRCLDFIPSTGQSCDRAADLDALRAVLGDMRLARTASTRPRSSGKRHHVRERWAKRSFSPADLLNLWEPIGAWERHRGLAYGGKPRQKLDVYKPRYAAKAPVVVFLYGGSWQRGSRDLYPPVSYTHLRAHETR